MPTDGEARSTPGDEQEPSVHGERAGPRGGARGLISPAGALVGSGALLLLLGVLGLPGSYDRAATSERLAALAISYGVFLLVSVVARRPGLFWWSVWGYAGIAAGSAAFGALAAEWSLVSDKIPLLSDVTSGLRVRIRTEPPLHPNILAGALLLPLPLAVSLPLLARGGRPRRGPRYASTAIALGVALLVLAVFLLTQSRTAFVALAATATLVGLRIGGRWTRGVAGAALLALLVGVVSFVHRAHRGGDEALETVGSVEARVEIWERGLSLAAERPLLGIGMDAFSHVVHRMRPFDEGVLASEFIAPDERIGHAHDLYLQTVLDLGVFGLLALLALFGSALAVLRDAWRGTTDPSIRCVALALAAGLVAHALFGVADAVPLGAKSGALLWMHLGLVHALQARDPRPAAPR